MRKTFIAGGVLSMALIAAACGYDAGDELAPADAASATSVVDEMVGMPMGDVSLTPALEVLGAEVAAGRFILLDSAPFGFEELAGRAWLARHADGTTVTLELERLLPNSQFIAHVHAGQCTEAGGAHYRFDPDGGSEPPNEIHLMFTSDSDGFGSMTAENPVAAGPQAQSVVVHPVNAMDAKLGCADLG